MGGVGEAGLDDLQPVSLQLEELGAERLGVCDFGDLSREQLLPELLTVPRPALDVRNGDGAMGGDGLGFRKRLLELADAEEVIAVAVGDVDVSQALAEGPHPLDQLGVLLDRGVGVDQYRVLVAVDQGGAVRDPLQVLGTVWQVTGDSLPRRGMHGVRERAIGH